MFYADTIGLPTILARVREYRERFGDYWKPAPLLERLVAEGRGLYRAGGHRDMIDVERPRHAQCPNRPGSGRQRLDRGLPGADSPVRGGHRGSPVDPPGSGTCRRRVAVRDDHRARLPHPVPGERARASDDGLRPGAAGDQLRAEPGPLHRPRAGRLARPGPLFAARRRGGRRRRRAGDLGHHAGARGRREALRRRRMDRSILTKLELQDCRLRIAGSRTADRTR